MKKVVYEFIVKMKCVYPVNEMKDFVWGADNCIVRITLVI